MFDSHALPPYVGLHFAKFPQPRRMAGKLLQSRFLRNLRMRGTLFIDSIP